MKFTVVGLYDNNDQVWVEHVDAPTADEAILVAGRMIIATNCGMDPGNLLVVSVFEGHLHDCNKHEFVYPVFPEVIT